MTAIVGVNVGDVLAGKYRVDKIIGTGGMGVVVAAQHLQLDERVALKFLLPETLANPEAVARFEREARAVVKIKNEHVARVIDVGALENGAPYIVMEYLEGLDLAKMLDKRGPILLSEAVDFLLQASEVLAEAHGLGIVHRDLKPSNLFITRRSDGSPCVKVLDFGISKMTTLGSSGPDMGMTKTASVMGSPLYMSPEQMESARNVDARTDIWALGVILYQLLTGRVPFEGETLPEVCMKIATRPPSPASGLRPGLPVAIDVIIARSLEKDRNRRYANVAELASALAEFGSSGSRVSAERISKIVQMSASQNGAAASSSGSIGAPQVGSGTELAVGATLGSWGRKAPQSTAPRKLIGALALIVSAAGIAVAAWVLLRRQTVPAQTPVSTTAVLAAGLETAAAAPSIEPAPLPLVEPATAPAESTSSDSVPNTAPSVEMMRSPPSTEPAKPSQSARGARAAAPRATVGRPASSSKAHPAAIPGNLDVYDDRR